jgi:hypothetical protein
MECARAGSQTAGTATRGVTRTTTRHKFAPGNGNDITLQDQVVVDSKITNAQLHVLSCDVSGGADLVSQLLHSLSVGAVEVFSVGQQIRPVRAVKQVKSGGSVVAPMLGALGPPPSVDLRPRAGGLMDASQGSHDDVPLLSSLRKHASGSSCSVACGCPCQHDEIS